MGQRKLFAHEIEERLDEILLLKLRQRSPRAVAMQLEAAPREHQESLLRWVGIAAQSANELGWLIASHGAAQAAELGDRLDDWVRAGLAAHDCEGIAAVPDALRRAAAAQRETALRPARGVAFGEIEGRLARFLQALDGRPLRLATAAQAWTDGETLWLPERLERAADANGNRRLYTVLAVQLWAQTRFGSFNVDPEPELSQWADREAALAWFALFEAMRLEARLAQELPGLARDIRLLRGPWPADLAAADDDLARPAATAADSLRWVAERRRVGAGGTPILAHLTGFDPLAARRLRAARIARDAATLRRALNILRANDPHARGGAGDDSHPPLAAEGDAVPADLLSGDIQALPPDAQAAAQSLAQDLDGMPPEILKPAGPGAWQPEERDAGETIVATVAGKPDAIYDEWDYRRAAWRRDWCQLYETEGPAGEDAWVDEVRRRHAHLIRSIRRRFEALRGEDKAERRQLDGEEIDLDAQVEARADRQSGSEPSPRLFVHRRRIERSLAVMFMVDMSGSTKGWVNDAERESLVLLCEAIEALGDRYAIYGFSGWTRTRCDIYHIKTFGERYDAATRRRIAGIEARDYTRMGVAVRHLSGLLQRQSTRHKLLVTLSDGRPDDHGDEYRGRYGIEDTRRALLEAREKGIRSYCVTIDRHGADYLPQLYGPAHYSVIDDARKLPQKIAEIYRKLTG
ncbi:MAG: nitric oxide reductase activation protein [Sulfuritalea sp.]|nr:nitric oxide reductase activation protein [Sulfuritalea sp.]